MWIYIILCIIVLILTHLFVYFLGHEIGVMLGLDICERKSQGIRDPEMEWYFRMRTRFLGIKAYAKILNGGDEI